MSFRPAFPSSFRLSKRKLGVTLAFLLLTVVAHLAVIEWVRHELPLVDLLDDEDESLISITLQSTPELPAPPAPKELPPPPPPKAADKAEPVAAVPVTV